jgi:hypothetical protein
LPTAISHRRSATSTTTKLLPPDIKSYWDRILERIDKPTAKQLLPHLDTRHPFAISPIPPSSSATTALPQRRPPLFSYFCEIKQKYPTSIILIRIGDFYETIGSDAVLLVQHAGLNPMGLGHPARAGFPIPNLRRTVTDLVQSAGLSVVVCEEAPENYSYGRIRSKAKDRYVAAVVSPASPHLMHGLLEQQVDVALEAAPPLIGIAPRVGGHALIEVSCDLRRVVVTEGLTDDAVYARLHEGGLAPPLFIHTSPAASSSLGGADHRVSAAPTAEKEWEMRVCSIFSNAVGAVQRYSDPVDPVQGMLRLVKKQLGLPPLTHFEVTTSKAGVDRPRPLYYSTATNLGLHTTKGVPSLLDAMLPPTAPLASRRWLRGVLLLPPSRHIAAAIHQACRSLLRLSKAIPSFSFPVLSPANVVLKLQYQQANDAFFRELALLCSAVGRACHTGELDPAMISFSDSVLQVAAEETGRGSTKGGGGGLDRSRVSEACWAVKNRIHQVIHHDDGVGTGMDFDYLMMMRTGTGTGVEYNSGTFSDEKDDEDDSYDNSAIRSSSSNNSNNTLALPRPLQQLLGANQATFYGKIRKESMPAEYAEVAACTNRVIDEAMALLNSAIAAAAAAAAAGGGGGAKPVTTTSSSSPSAARQQPRLSYDVANNSIWLKLPNKSLLPLVSTTATSTSSDDDARVVRHPKDRNGRTDTSSYSTDALDRALNDYRRAVDIAEKKVRIVLQDLAAELGSKYQNELVTASMFAVIAAGLDAHVREGRRKGWNLPHLNNNNKSNGWRDDDSSSMMMSPSPSLSSSSSTSCPHSTSSPLVIKGMWPYWMDDKGVNPGQVVRNDVRMEGMFLLTGPNMAGKSTILRSVAAVSLLGACGFLVPAAAGGTNNSTNIISGTSIPYIDAFMLRNFSADSPLEGRSAFAVEMTEMRHVLEDATSQSLVLVDELGKGTEVRAGTALAAAMLEALDERKCRGVFATHLHSLLDMPLQLENTVAMMMETKNVVTEQWVEEGKGNTNSCTEGDKEEEEEERDTQDGGRYIKTRKKKMVKKVQPTWRIVPGSSRESLAIDVARECRLPEHLVARAEQYYYDTTLTNNTSTTRESSSSSSFSSSSSSSSSLVMEEYSLTDAGRVLASTAKHVVSALTAVPDKSSKSSMQITVAYPQFKVYFVRAGELPPPSTVGESAVYVMRRSDGWWYCGSTDSMTDRLMTHRGERGGGSQVNDPQAECCYILMSEGGGGGGGNGGGSSMAMAVESEVIKVLHQAGFPLLSTTDAGKRHNRPKVIGV